MNIEILKNIDLIIKNGEIGSDLTYIECKKYLYNELGWQKTKDYHEYLDYICDKLEY